MTKGLDPSVPMKDSGIEWLGEIPAHWEVDTSHGALVDWYKQAHLGVSFILTSMLKMAIQSSILQTLMTVVSFPTLR